jgi:hypothetical protein
MRKNNGTAMPVNIPTNSLAFVTYKGTSNVCVPSEKLTPLSITVLWINTTKTINKKRNECILLNNERSTAVYIIRHEISPFVKYPVRHSNLFYILCQCFLQNICQDAIEIPLQAA